MTNHDHHHIIKRSWPSTDEVRQHYKARSLALQKIGHRLSEALEKPDLSEAAKADILFFFEFFPDYRY